VTEKKKKKKKKQVKSLDFIVPIKLTSTMVAGGGQMKKKKKKNQKNLHNMSKHKNSKCFSWVTAVRALPLAGSHSPRHLPRMPPNTVLIFGPAVGPAQILNLLLVLCVLASNVHSYQN